MTQYNEALTEQGDRGLYHLKLAWFISCMGKLKSGLASPALNPDSFSHSLSVCETLILFVKYSQHISGYALVSF